MDSLAPVISDAILLSMIFGHEVVLYRVASRSTTSEPPIALRRRGRFSSTAATAVAALGLGLSLADSAYDSRRDIARQNGSEQHTAWKCYGPDECARMNGVRETTANSEGGGYGSERWL
jgi:hypothetical protein